MRSPYAETLTQSIGRPWHKVKQRLGQERGRLRPVAISPTVRAKWLREAQELQAEAFVQRSLDCAALNRKNECSSSLVELLERPVVALDAERRSQSLETHAALSPTVSAQLAGQQGDAQQDLRIVCHERVRDVVSMRPRCFAALRRRDNGRPLAIDPLLSDEMRLKLQTHLEAKIQGSIWQNEIRSRLARPLSASTFCSDERLDHPLAARKFIVSADPAVPPSTSIRTPCDNGDERCERVTRFPYSVDAHAFAGRIRRCYRTYRFRIDVSKALRRLALAIRMLRRRAIPSLVKGFRRRQSAAIRIQSRFRRYIGWKDRVLRPFVIEQIALWIALGSLVARARLVIAKGVTRLYLMRRCRREAAERRARHLRRWSAKTRVCLFVHQVWIVRWLRRKRKENVACMWKEMQALEAIERDVHSESKVMLATSFGKSLLKKELVAWRKTVRSPALDTESHNDADTDAMDGESDRFVRFKQCFRVFDFDQSGSLDLDEFELLLAYLRGKPPRKPGRRLSEAQRRAIPPRLTIAQVRNLFDDLDVDGNGRITYEELEKWWQSHMATKSSTSLSSASSSYLSGGLDRLLLQSHGLLFWLLGRKQQLEKKFVKKLMEKRAQDAAKLAYLQEQLQSSEEDHAKAFRCPKCARRFGLRRDLTEHAPARGGDGCEAAETIVVDTFVLKKWIYEEEFRLLDE